MPSRRFNSIAIVSNGTPEADEAAMRLRALHGDVPPETADVIVALGGDGLMLETLHKVMPRGIPVYGMNFGTIGFLMNAFDARDVVDKLEAARETMIFPLLMRVTDVAGKQVSAYAFNEVSLFRTTYQAAKVRVSVDGELRLSELICDGVLVATPAGSTAYNLSAHGPILPINSPLLVMTPISPFRPRRWRGAVLSNRARVIFTCLETRKRPVSAVADNIEYVDAQEVEIVEDRTRGVTLLFDPGHGLEERVLNEQFQF
ncbi:MAG: NAD kinase [Alphaproteobacteria bacterium]|nr:NAD kinase [Alphaproteobacteria bacterium]